MTFGTQATAAGMYLGCAVLDSRVWTSQSGSHAVEFLQTQHGRVVCCRRGGCAENKNVVEVVGAKELNGTQVRRG